jgi:hypothetical protein
MSQLHYWAQQEDRWHQQYLMAEKYCDTLEQRVHELEQAIVKAVHDCGNEDDRIRLLKTALGSIYESC